LNKFGIIFALKKLFLILALSTLAIKSGMGCLPNLFNSEWRFNLLGPKLSERNFKLDYQEGYQRKEKDFNNDEEKKSVDSIQPSRNDVTAAIKFSEGKSLKLRYKKNEKKFQS